MQEFKVLYLASVNHIREIEKKLEKVSEKLNENKIAAELQILDNADLKQLFNISDKTLINWRNTGLIPYSKIGGSIYYNLSDVKQLIQDTKITKKKG